MKQVDFWFHHGGISVPDLDASIRWWQEKLGFEIERQAFIAAADCRMALLRNGSLRVELLQPMNGRSPARSRAVPTDDLRTFGNKYVTFACDDIEVMAEVLRKRSVEILSPSSKDAGASFFIRDNSGVPVQFVAAQEAEMTAHI